MDGVTLSYPLGMVMIILNIQSSIRGLGRLRVCAVFSSRGMLFWVEISDIVRGICWGSIPYVSFISKTIYMYEIRKTSLWEYKSSPISPIFARGYIERRNYEMLSKKLFLKDQVHTTWNFLAQVLRVNKRAQWSLNHSPICVHIYSNVQ